MARIGNSSNNSRSPDIRSYFYGTIVDLSYAVCSARLEVASSAEAVPFFWLR